MLFKTRLAGKCYLAHRVFSPHTILFNCDAEAGLNQRFPSDGEFNFENGYCMFVAKSLNADDMTIKGGFTLRLRSSATLTFRLSPFPAEVQEGILYEANYG
jgi:hypothetical protein